MGHLEGHDFLDDRPRFTNIKVSSILDSAGRICNHSSNPSAGGPHGTICAHSVAEKSMQVAVCLPLKPQVMPQHPTITLAFFRLPTREYHIPFDVISPVEKYCRSYENDIGQGFYSTDSLFFPDGLPYST